MTDKELYAICLPLLEALIERHMLVGSIRHSPSGVWVISAVIGLNATQPLLVVLLEDDAESIASATSI